MVESWWVLVESWWDLGGILVGLGEMDVTRTVAVRTCVVLIFFK